MLLKRHLAFFIPDPVDDSINAHSILWTLSYLTIKKVAAAQVCSEESASTTLSPTMAKVAPMV